MKFRVKFLEEGWETLTSPSLFTFAISDTEVSDKAAFCQLFCFWELFRFIYWVWTRVGRKWTRERRATWIPCDVIYRCFNGFAVLIARWRHEWTVGTLYVWWWSGSDTRSVMGRWDQVLSYIACFHFPSCTSWTFCSSWNSVSRSGTNKYLHSARGDSYRTSLVGRGC